LAVACLMERLGENMVDRQEDSYVERILPEDSYVERILPRLCLWPG